MKAEPNTARAPIPIGTPVKPIIEVKAIELSGAVATTVIKPPRINPIIIGEVSWACIKTVPIWSKVEFTTGSITIAIPLAKGAATNIITIKSSPAGTFFSKNLTTKDIKYPAINPGSIPYPETVKPTNTA